MDLYDCVSVLLEFEGGSGWLGICIAATWGFVFMLHYIAHISFSNITGILRQTQYFVAFRE